MHTYALIQNGIVWELVSGVAPPEAHPALVYVDVTSVSPAPQEGWTATETGGVWSFAAPVATPAQGANAMLAQGCQIVSTGTPALNGTYALDPATQSRIQAEIISILVNGTFTNGGTTIAWPDVSGAAHSCTIAQFKALATALGGCVTTLIGIAQANSGTLPTQPVTIA